MIPLIGGSALGCERSTGCKPMFHLSYEAFRKNESHLQRYWPDVPWLRLDSSHHSFQLSGQEQIDFVTSVCPCAGLSMLNCSRTGQAARGADAVQNDWMIKTAEYVLGDVRPQVYWGENAPALFDERELVERLRGIGERFGYSFSLVKTNSELHGLPQRRIRTFYFYWRSPTVPRLAWKETAALSLCEYLELIPDEASQQDIYVHTGKASERFRPYQFVLEREGLTHQQFSKKIGRNTIAKYLEKKNWIDDCIAWMEKNYPNESFSLTGRAKTHIYV